MPPTYFPLRWESTGDQWWYASPIDWAAANGHYDLVRELLRLDGNHLIQLASLRRIRRLETVWDDDQQFDDVASHRSSVARKLLLECDSKGEKSGNSLIAAGYGGWLLYAASSAGDLCFVRELLQRDALLVFGEGEYGVTDILYAAARSKNSEVFRMVYDFAVSPRFFDGREMVEYIGDIPPAYKQQMKNRALHAAARGGNLKALKELLCDCSDNVLAFTDVQGSTILHAAAGRGQVEVVKDLIASFDIVDCSDTQGNTALHVAAYRGHYSVVEALIKASPSSVLAVNNSGETFLHVAVTGFEALTFRRMDCQVSLMNQLVRDETFGVRQIINARDNEGRTALHLGILGNIHTDLVELLMSVRSIDVNVRDSSGMTPLDLLRQRPCSASSDLLTRQLISAGAMLNCYGPLARKIIASHINMGSLGGSPGTSFKVPDSEIFLCTGPENRSDPIGFARHSSSSADVNRHGYGEESRLDSTAESYDFTKKKRKKGVTRFLVWARKKDKKLERLNTRVEELKFGGIPIPLRERYSKPSSPSLPNNKHTLSVRSDVSSPTTKKRLPMGGVMQAKPHLNVARMSHSSSFSKVSVSSDESCDKQAGPPAESGVVGPSCSDREVDDGIPSFVRRPGTINRRLLRSYLCFGGPGPTKNEREERQGQQQEVYDRYVLSVA